MHVQICGHTQVLRTIEIYETRQVNVNKFCLEQIIEHRSRDILLNMRLLLLYLLFQVQRDILSMLHQVIDLHTHYLRAQRLGQSSHLLVEEVLGLLPNSGGVAILQLEEAGQESLTELLGALTGHQRRQVVNTDNTERRVLEAGGESHGNGGLVEGGCNVVDGNRVVGVGATAKGSVYMCLTEVLRTVLTCRR